MARCLNEPDSESMEARYPEAFILLFNATERQARETSTPPITNTSKTFDLKKRLRTCVG